MKEINSTAPAPPNGVLHTAKTELFYQAELEHHRTDFPPMQDGDCAEWDGDCAEWPADEIAYKLEISLTDDQLAGVEAEIKAGHKVWELGEDEVTAELIGEAQECENLNNVVVIDHDDLSITQGILEKVAAGEQIDDSERNYARIVAEYLGSRYRIDGCWLETPIQRHARYVADKLLWDDSQRDGPYNQGYKGFWIATKFSRFQVRWYQQNPREMYVAGVYASIVDAQTRIDDLIAQATGNGVPILDGLVAQSAKGASPRTS